MRRSHRENKPGSRPQVCCSPPRKRKRTNDGCSDNSDNIVGSSPPGSIAIPSPLSPSPAMSLASGVSPPRSPLPMVEPCRSAILSQASLDHNPARRALDNSSDTAEALMTTDGSHFDIPSSGPTTCAPPTTPVRGRDSCWSPLPAADMSVQPAPLVPRQTSRCNVLSLLPASQSADTASTVQPKQSPVSLSVIHASRLHSHVLSDPNIASSDPCCNGTEIRQPRLPRMDTACSMSHPGLRTSDSISDNAMLSDAAFASHSGAAIPLKPMSLRDRRARGLLSDHDVVSLHTVYDH
ncbi:uncharacterized protein PHACADRAFT_167295 [Phanerochaete carnosa HHB-10118-sp]|uniref:Uncharacterized protein n=1 Tax=Phanerochaete carnosa (strain HHB-10118-sp) TaxID=650164 RepID=K5UI10_PHACS|nr:uncharacterized protein PHACADRAFT_167295 [Phanerochaete carnosa HHB-10118-sp]EKM49161.1 hypothetical protein PHACADRAFT_167295 [Phanerochaete carnosa HHB-10118-sp]